MAVEVEPETISNESVPILHSAAEQGKYETVKALIEAGADVNVVNDNGLTSLHLAKGKLASFYLLNAGANVSAKSTLDYTPLHLAAQSNDLEKVKMLCCYFEADTSVNNFTFQESEKGYTPLQLAIVNKHVAMVELLLHSGAIASIKIKSNTGSTARSLCEQKLKRSCCAEAGKNMLDLLTKAEKVPQWGVRSSIRG